MKRIAYLSPVNPAPSGISDYSEELLPYLAQYADITLYVDNNLRPTNQQMMRHLTVRPIKRLPRDHRRRPYDAILYHMGNNGPVHAAIWQMMQRIPSIVVMHEFVLHHFMLSYAATVLHDTTHYQTTATTRYGEEGAHIARLMLHGRFTEAAFDLPFCEDVLAKAQGVIAHSQHVVERVTALQPNLPVAQVPMGVPLPALIDRNEARARLGLPLDTPIIASFGHINPYKRIDLALRAMKTLRETYVDLRYILVGSISPNYDIQAAIVRTGLSDVVTVTGYVDRQDFEDYVAAADICLNLRHPTAGETSASLLRLLGAGRPTLVTASGSFVELPANVAAQVDPDVSEGDLIIAYCRLLLDRPDIAAALGTNARTYIAREHTLEGAALGYMRFLADHYGWGAVQKQREAPLWSIEQSVKPTPVHSTKTTSPIQAAQPHPPHPLSTATAQALAEIGVTEDDTNLLQNTAQTIAELLDSD
ncbi:MAG: glycosyltransferase [Chloroflexi bacterium AL-W]|nr:glycosyltransferase [Chloroflexi bacterium AL-N1]NOK65604.1 glycosyltransferase [Chloroflexi bacterium AL-N10]NOK74455.1 glycosyltransferase [Chloroflexi bacterium AL-N5]NOK80637.1 glycosyltransferase [Chloroflexi bacterium AL-W]NOK88713.1 glycosyltransferase [Chloroflexi bacterium AL-N15]